MSTSAEQITDLIQAGNTWQGKANDLLADRQAHEAAYAGLSNNLKGVVNSQMYYVAFVDPDEAAPTNQDNGTFTTIHDAMFAAPFGAFVDIRLAPGKTHVIQSLLNLNNRYVNVRGNSPLAGADPIVEFASYISGSAGFEANAIYGFSASGSGTLRFFGCDLRISDKADAALGWGARSSIFRYNHATQNRIEMYACNITGFVGSSIASAHGGDLVSMGLFSTTLDGPFVAVKELDNGVGLIGVHSLTLLNGATLYDEGTLGTTILTNN